jgi:hypothetical protein
MEPRKVYGSGKPKSYERVIADQSLHARLHGGEMRRHDERERERERGMQEEAEEQERRERLERSRSFYVGGAKRARSAFEFNDDLPFRKFAAVIPDQSETEDESEDMQEEGIREGIIDVANQINENEKSIKDVMESQGV